MFSAILPVKEGVVGLLGNRWVFQQADGSTQDIEALCSPSLVTLLEFPLPEFRQHLDNGLQAQKLPGRKTGDFPFSAIVNLGSRWGTAYWESLALNWAEEVSEAAALHTGLSDVAVRGKSQRNRHRARHLLQRLRLEASAE